MRKSGILMPVASLPGPYGIGTIGKPACRFIDFLCKAGQSVWQILPLSPTGYGASPYQSCSAFAGNPVLIDPDLLRRDGLLKKGEYEAAADAALIDYEAAQAQRFSALRKAFARFSRWYPEEYYRFCYEQRDWVEDYALFMTARGLYGAPYRTWPAPLRAHQREAIEQMYAQHEDEIHFWKFCQYEFFRQWNGVRAYAAGHGIEILGDIPIYVSEDSADVWASPRLFMLDADGAPTHVAGCPPDYFSADGQLWGNPLYDWAYHEQTKFAWWLRRIRSAAALYDIVRIDHFRAFDTYYAIPAGAPTARSGEWRIGPRMKLFDAVRSELGDVKIVAEDLGEMFESVRTLLKESGYPGMKVLQFAFDPSCESEYLPHRYPVNSVAYTGTHDNATLLEWWKTAGAGERKKAAAYLGLNREEGIVRGLIRGAMASPSALCVVPLADWLGLGPEGRINTPSTVGGRNWRWRAKSAQLTPALAKRIAAVTALYGRA